MIKWLIMASSLVLAGPAPAQTLREAIAAAYESNPQLAAARARQEALAEAPEQARAAGRPVINSTGDTGYDRFTYGSSASARIGAVLPIWTGGRVASAVRAATGDVAAGAEGLRDTEAAVLEDVVAAYAALLYNQQAVEVARVGIERLDRQVAEAKSRFDLGKATLTDIAQLKAQRATVVANLADAEGALATAAAAYRAAVGQDAGTLSADVPPPVALPATRAAAREAAKAANPLLLQQRRVLEAAAARVDQARAERAPSIDLAGSYGGGARLVDREVHGYRSAAAIGIAFRLPLLTGGLVSSRVRQAEAGARAEHFQADAAEREALRAVDAGWAAVTAAQLRLRASMEGLDAADIALKGVRAEYGFGLRSTIDLLVADQSFRAAQLAVASSRANVLVAQAALLRATGQLDEAAYQ
ncbi:TolC family outer membrane protein [Sphingomonas pokkalii]|uniref:Type I secretion protein TolC n=1 Tax=Sphingomonas pokkalii TaxID=2175090 RepID=A0A2U0SC14_9SPHN|nr:TolC family outer membrane protein [Sphingomonas pokkalii]PVX28854.1 type I secretion protein TolC [Sphingomonas pokkalii]